MPKAFRKRPVPKRTMKDLDGNEIVIPDLRQEVFWDNYLNPKSKTFGDPKKSCLAAGFSKSYADKIRDQRFYIEKVRRLNLLSNAEKVLHKTLTMDTLDEKGQEKSDLLRIQNDSAKFVAKTLGKDHGYTERTELGGKDGNPVVFMPLELFEKYDLGDKKED